MAVLKESSRSTQRSSRRLMVLPMALLVLRLAFTGHGGAAVEVDFVGPAIAGSSLRGLTRGSQQRALPQELLEESPKPSAVSQGFRNPIPKQLREQAVNAITFFFWILLINAVREVYILPPDHQVIEGIGGGLMNF